MYRDQLLADAINGDIRAQYELAKLYESGEGVATDSSKAEEWLRRASDGGHAKAQCDLGKRYVYNRNFNEAEDVLSRASKQGLAEAQFELGSLYYPKLGEYEKAIYWLTESANQNYTDAQYSLGYMLGKDAYDEKYYKLQRPKVCGSIQVV